MEVKEKSKKRELIKSVAIVFLVILLILTFFSNTIMNYSLAEVATTPISSGTINAKIRGSGTVEANESYEVILPQTREVRSINVRVGDFVSQGDVLFVLGDVESQELIGAQEQLESLQMQYEQRLLNLALQHDSEDRVIRTLREELEEIVRQRDENSVTTQEITAAQEQLTAAKSKLADIDNMLKQLGAALNEDGSYAQAQADVSKWTAEREAALALVEEYTRQLSELDFDTDEDMERVLEDAKKALTTAKNRRESDWDAYKDIYRDLLDKAGAKYSEPLSMSILTNTAAQKKIATYLAVQALKDPQSEEDPQDSDYALHKQIYDILMADQEAVDAAQQTYDRLLDDIEDAESDASERYSEIRKKLKQAEADYETADYRLEQAERALASAEAANKSLTVQIANMEDSRDDQSAEVERLTEQLSALKEKRQRYEDAVEQARQKERAIEEALAGKDIDNQLEDLELQSLRKQIEKAQELVDKYTTETVDAEVRANVSGRISAINVIAGKEAPAGSSMATIELVDRGYMLKLPVTNEQSRQVRVGDTANVTNYYWGGEIEAVLESIVADPANPGRGKLLVFRLNGEVEAGVNLTLSIGQRSANYDAIIPKSALRQDANGYFVLVITVKSTPLSNRYIATRVDVQVLAEDDTSAAVSGLSAGDFVITTSNKPVEAGHQVRMVENP